MASINLGRVGFVLRGTWSSGATYNPLDVVLYNGTSYAAKTTSTGLAPSAASAAWQELTQVSAAVSSGIAESAVRYDTSQNLNGSQKTTARDNIGAASNASVSAVQGTVSNLSSRVNIAEGHVETLTNSLSDLSDQLETDEENISGLQERMETAEGDIEDIRADIAYTPIELNSFTISPTEAEMGSTVTSVSYSYSANKVPATLTINGNAITPAQSGSGTLTESLTTGKTWVMAATDDGSPSYPHAHSSKTATLTFMNNVYYGVAAIPSSIDNAFIIGMNKTLTTTMARTLTLNVSSGKYAWYASPTRLGACTFKVGGFDGGFEPAQTVSVTNSSGYTENYYVYRSTNPNLGLTTITIS